MKNRFLFILFFLPLSINAQFSPTQQQAIDSLKDIIESADNDTLKISAMYELDNIIYVSDPALDLELNKKIVELCDKNLKKKLTNQEIGFYKNKSGSAINALGIIYSQMGDYKTGVQYFERSLQMKKETGDKKGIAAALNNIGNIYKFNGEYSKALDYYFQNLIMSFDDKNTEGIANSLSNIAGINADLGNYAGAIEYLMMALKVDEQSGDKHGMSIALLKLGVEYREQGDNLSALKYYNQSLKVSTKIGDQTNVAACLDNIGIILAESGDTTKALSYHLKSLKIREEAGNKPGIAISYINIGDVYADKKEYDKAIDFYNKALEVNKENIDESDHAFILNNIAIAYKNKNQTGEAISYGERSLRSARETGNILFIRNAGKLLYESYKQEGNYKNSLENLELYYDMRDSIASTENINASIQQKYKYDYEKKSTIDSVRRDDERKLSETKIIAQDSQLKQEQTKRYALYGGLSLLFIFGGFMYNRFRVTQRQKKIIELQKTEVELQKEIVEEKNKEILDSINYARRLQEAILPPQKLVKEYLKDSFILYKPKDIVAGDFYFLEPIADKVIFAAADCTGHGVPGAMVSVVCSNALNRTVKEFGVFISGEILNKVRELVMETFSKSESEVKDGMDISLCVLDLSKNELLWSGANNPLWIIRKNAEEIEEIKPDKQPIGKYADAHPFTTHKILLGKGDSIYIFTDGYADQFGGKKGKKFKASNMKELFLSIKNEPMESQRILINKAFEKWKGNLEQIDDVCVIGIRI